MVITHFLLPLSYGFGTCQNGEFDRLTPEHNLFVVLLCRG
jgi:hypothetical protein